MNIWIDITYELSKVAGGFALGFIFAIVLIKDAQNKNKKKNVPDRVEK